MILLVVARETRLKDLLSEQFVSRGGNVIHYRNPIKAIDNLEEIQPDVVVFYTQDFPRHWKPFARYYRNLKNKENGICVLFTGDLFTEDEAGKAHLLDINGLIPYDQEDHHIVSSFEDILQRYIIFDDDRLHRRYTPKDFDKLAFMFSHPSTFMIITGIIIDINLTGVRFLPDFPEKTSDIPEDSVLQGCSLQIEDEIFTFNSRIIRNNKIITLTFADIQTEAQSKLSEYISDASKRALHSSIS